jgi:hypothetical protein
MWRSTGVGHRRGQRQAVQVPAVGGAGRGGGTGVEEEAMLTEHA